LRLRWIELLEFRNHEHTHLQDIPDGLVVEVGPNGEGKTNLMEGMFFLLSLTSPRATANAPMVREGREAGYVRGEVETTEGVVLVEVEIPIKGASRVKVNRNPVRRKRDLRRQVRGVFFGPHDLRIVGGDPSQRRGFMDEAFVSLWPLKESVISAYDRALRQRNRLLKEWEGRGVPKGIEAWDAELVEAGCALMRARARTVSRLRPAAETEYQWLAGYGLHCAYQPSVGETILSAEIEDVREDPELEDAFRERIEQRRTDEIARRTTLVGPHRDELEVAVRDLGVRAFASHGESWAAALCLRLGLAAAVHEELGETPVLLLDDPFSALDPARQAKVAEHLDGRGQVVVSVADEAHVPARAAAVWEIHAGSVSVRGAA
jgi:DNA replication and repair protein RecF